MRILPNMSILLVTVLLVLTSGICGQSVDNSRPLTHTEFLDARSHLDPKLVPLLRSPIEADGKQAFLIPGVAGQFLRMIPIRYDA